MTSRNPAGKPRKIAGQQGWPADPSSVEPVETPAADDGAEGPGVSTSSPNGGGGRRTWLLVAAIVVLLLAVAAEIVYLTREPAATVSADRPVVTGELSHRSAVETASRSAVEILSTSHENYDEQVEQATAKMTDGFAEEYRQLSADIRDRFVENRTTLQFEAVGQGVVQASRNQVQALLFLNQYVEKVVDGEPQTDYGQYRALVTVVRTDQGWLVSDIETK